jgi:hypothetical protein
MNWSKKIAKFAGFTILSHKSKLQQWQDETIVNSKFKD